MPYRTPPLTANAIRKMHWAQQNRIKVQLSADVAKLVQFLKLPRGLRSITVHLVYYAGSNRKQDADNIAPTLKGAIDGLVLAKVIRDDNADIVVDSGQRIVTRARDPNGLNRPRLYLIVTEVGI